METLLSTAEAARLAGVGTTSVKRWADEGVLECLKTAGGHRRFERSTLEAFLRTHGAPSESEPLALWLALLVSGGTYELRAALFEARGRLGAWFRVADELAPVLTELGARWECGDLSVLDEHVASERIARALANVTDALPVGERGPVCLLACAEGDEHTLGLSLAELCLREAGWATLWAGRRTPIADLVGAVERGGIGMVALSASTVSADSHDVAEQLRRIETACGVQGIPL
ncbi:MAG TPA: helix-turn-helix domain-containing protein, partial [Polyangiaceae bacterium]|nr:helix-turn-helix domain-containing protein [Polyangiaceae bacterium]